MLASIDKGIGSALAIFTVLTAFMLIMAYASTKMTWANMLEFGAMLAAMSLAILSLGLVIKMVSELDAHGLIKGGIAVTLVAGIMVGLVAMTKLISSREVDKGAAALIKIAATLMLMIFVVKLASKLDPEEVLYGTLAITAFVGLMGAFAIITRLMTGKDKKVASSLLAMSLSLGLMVVVVKAASKLSLHEIEKGVKCIAVFGLLIAGMMLITRIAPEHELKGVARTILAMSISIGILAGVTALLSLVKEESLKRGLSAVGLLSAFMTAMIWATRGANNCKGNLIVMTVAIALLSISVAALSQIPFEQLAPAVAAVSLLMGMFAILVKSAANVQGAWKTLLAMTLATAALAGIVIVLSKMVKDGDNAIKTSIALGLLMLSMAGVLTIVNKIGATGMNALKGVGLLTAMVVPLIAFALGIRTVPDLTGKEKSILTLVGVMAAMSLLLFPLTLIGKFLSTGTTGLGLVGALAALAAMAGELWIFAQAINSISSVSVNTTALKAICEAMTVMTLLLIPLTAIGAVIGMTGGVAGLGLLGALAALALMAGELWIFAQAIDILPDVTASIPSLNAILEAMKVMCDLLIRVSLVAPLAVIAVGAIGAMEGLLVVFGAIVTLIGFIDEHCDNFQKFIDSGCQILIKLANALGQCIGAFVGGIAEGMMTALPGIADSITEFVAKMAVAGQFAKLIDDGAVDGALNIVKMVGAITAAEWINKLGSIFGNTSMDEFSEQLIGFAGAVGEFAKALKENGVDTEAVKAAGDAGAAIAKLYDSLPRTGGWMQKIFGEAGDMGEFGDQLKAFGEAIVTFCSTVDGKVTQSVVEEAANAGIAVAKLYEHLPKEEGWAQRILGETMDFKTFGTQLTAFGRAIVDFSAEVDGKVDKKAVKTAASAGETIAGLYESMPKEEGWMQKIFGKTTTMDEFGAQLRSFGTALVEFSTMIAGGENVKGLDSTAVENAKLAGDMMTTLQKSIPEDKAFDGKMSLDDFGGKIKKFGEYLKKYSDEVSNIDQNAVNQSVAASEVLVTVAKQASRFNKDNIDKFKNVEQIGVAIKAYADQVKDIAVNKLSSSVTSIDKLVTALNKMSNIDTSGVSNFSSAVAALGKISLDEISKAFNGAAEKMANVGMQIMDALTTSMSSKQNELYTVASSIINMMVTGFQTNIMPFHTIGMEMTKQFVAGMAVPRASVIAAATAISASAVDTLRKTRDTFYSAGSYICSGLAKGIRDNQSVAITAARNMANAVKEAAKEALKINSPSKIFVAIGSGVIEGFVKGIADNMSYTTAAVSDMGDVATKGFSDAISSIADLINGDMDSQPTIRPVLDLSDVEEGASAIGSLLGLTPALSMSSNAKAISSLMNQRNQNGTNDDIISAINKLRGDLGKTGNNTYNVNGLTYNEGSDVADALKTIIRAATIERRV